MGLFGVVNIGFNENVVWIYIFLMVEYFVVYQLIFDENDEFGFIYMVDGNRCIIYEKLF